jgi:hypothetical protein
MKERKDKNLRKFLGIHGDREYLCGCDTLPEHMEPDGELPRLWREIQTLNKRVHEMRRLLLNSTAKLEDAKTDSSKQ